MPADKEFPYARSTIQEKLTGRALPDWPFVEAFVRACARHARWPDVDVDLVSWRTDYRQAAREVEEEVDRQRQQLAAQRALADLPAPTVSELLDVVPAHITAWKVPLRNPHFIGRERELDQIRSSLINAPTLIVQSIRGLGGIGKTQIAIEYAHRFANQYDIVWWVDAEDPSTIPIQLGPLAVDLGIASITESNIALELVKAELRCRNRWLMVFDNAEDVDKIRKMLPSGSGHVLVTTRRPRFGSLGLVLDLDISAALRQSNCFVGEFLAWMRARPMNSPRNLAIFRSAWPKPHRTLKKRAHRPRPT